MLALAAAAVLFPGGTWGLAQSQVVAATVWHRPCDGQVLVREAPLPLHVYAYAQTPCGGVTFNDTIRLRWVDACTILIHEVGHEAGYRDPSNPADPEHSANPKSVMYFEYDPSHPDARCRHYGVPYLLAHETPFPLALLPPVVVPPVVAPVPVVQVGHGQW